MVITNLPDIHKLIAKEAIDHLIEIFPQPSILAALCCIPPVLMICYYTALMKGINPDENVINAINFNQQVNK